MATAKKLSKEELREDRVATALRELSEQVQQNLRWVVTGAVVLVVALAAIILIRQTRARAEENASSAMYQAELAFYAGNYGEALTQFQTVSGRYGSTRAGRMAPIFVGNCQLSLGDAAAAETAFRSMIAKAGSDDPIVRSGAWRGLGSALADQGKAAEAGEAYQKAAETEGNLMAVDDWMAAGAAYLAAARSAEAAHAYQQALELDPKGQRGQEARVRLEEARAGS